MNGVSDAVDNEGVRILSHGSGGIIGSRGHGVHA